MNSRKGFTLIELLVVIAIIAILAAILFPVFTSAKEKSRQSACLSNMKQGGTGFLLYAQDWNDKLPLVSTTWYKQIVRYIGGGNTTKGHRYGVDFMRCPSQPKTTLGTYLVNYGPDRGGVFGYLTSRRMTTVPPKVFMMADGDDHTSLLCVIYSPAVWYYTIDKDGDGIKDTYSMNRVTIQVYNYANPAAHMGGSNYLFVGGHVRWVSKKAWLMNEKGIWGDQTEYSKL